MGRKFRLTLWLLLSFACLNPVKSNQIKPFISIRPLQALLNCQEENKKVKLQSQSQEIITCKSIVVALHTKMDVFFFLSYIDRNLTAISPDVK